MTLPYPSPILGHVRALLLLGRVSNLPTVWSNCLAGWWLGGGGNIGSLALVSLSGTCLYVAGMFLNDAFDVSFDRQYRPERPIPSGAISLSAVWGWAAVWLAIGLIVALLFGRHTLSLALILTGCILLYDAAHKVITFAPLIMASCRFTLLIMAASVGQEGVTGLAVWSAIVLALYITGLSFIARRESTRGPLAGWPVLLFVSPVLLAVLVNPADLRLPALALSAVYAVWVILSLRFTLWRRPKEISRTVSGLLAGIVLVDWVASADVPVEMHGWYLALFVAALFFQRIVPAT